MPTFRQNEYCKNCKKNVSTNKSGKCPICNSTTIKSLWNVRFYIQELNGNKIRKTLSGFKTKKQANIEYINFITKYQHINKNNDLKFNQIYIKYLNEKKLTTKESSTFSTESIFNNYIIPYFRNTDINNYNKDFLQKWQNIIWNLRKINGQNYKYTYLETIRFALNNFLNYCEIEYEIPNNLKFVKKPINTSIKEDIIFWELDEFNRFISHCNFNLTEYNDCLWYTYFILSYYSGLRIGELTALTETDIINKNLFINKTINTKTHNNSYKITTTKNYKTYNKKIPNIAYQAIIDFINLKKSLKIDNTFLFGTNTPLPQKTIRRKLYNYINLANNNITDINKKLKIITPHGFRHSYVSLLIHLGCSTKTVAELIGDTEKMIITTYSHLY